MIGDIQVCAEIDEDFEITHARDVEIDQPRLISSADVGFKQLFAVTTENDVHVSQGPVRDDSIDAHNGLEAPVFGPDPVAQQGLRVDGQTTGIAGVAKT